ncbi:MAG: helix-turn-helix transcriptional regulator [Waterburya sp.]
MIRNKIQILLESYDVTAYAVARDLLLYPQTIYQLAKDREKLPKSYTLDLICSYFDCDVDDVLEFLPKEEIDRKELAAKSWEDISEFQQ